MSVEHTVQAIDPMQAAANSIIAAREREYKEKVLNLLTEVVARLEKLEEKVAKKHKE
jgi:hypothetical protein